MKGLTFFQTLMFKFQKRLLRALIKQKQLDFNRVVPYGDYYVERSEKAALLGFGKGTTVYDSSVIIRDVSVGENTWIGPHTVLDGSGKLVIGSHCSISAGVQIYSHSTVDWALSGGKDSYDYSETHIGNNCYIGPNVIISKGVRIGDNVVIGANSFVNQDIPNNSKAYGNPVKIKPLDRSPSKHVGSHY